MPKSGRTTIVIDPVTHRKAQELAKKAGMPLTHYIGNLIAGSVKDLEHVLAASSCSNCARMEEKFKQIKQIINED